MDFVNSTRMVAGFTMGTEPSGQEWLVIAIKGTFRLPLEQATLQLHEVQEPLCTGDVFFGEPGRSAPKYEADFPLRKGRCDLLLNATAHSPGGHAARKVPVSVSVGNWSKSFTVLGDRVWEAGLTGIGASATVPFVRMPISYDRAFGGTDDKSNNPADHSAFMTNPSGRGFHKNLRREWVDGSPMPNTEEDGRSVTRPNDDYRPMSFGPIGRHWSPRVSFTGTYDDAWLENVFPFLPSDFDERYYQAAPTDQQLPIPTGEQLVTLSNLTPDGRRAFVLPHLEAPVHIFPKRGGREDLTARVDTIIIEPDLDRIMMTWRVARRLKRNMLEIAEVLVGKKGPEWWQDRERGVFPLQLITLDDAPTSEGSS